MQHAMQHMRPHASCHACHAHSKHTMHASFHAWHAPRTACNGMPVPMHGMCHASQCSAPDDMHCHAMHVNEHARHATCIVIMLGMQGLQ